MVVVMVVIVVVVVVVVVLVVAMKLQSNIALCSPLLCSHLAITLPHYCPKCVHFRVNTTSSLNTATSLFESSFLS